MLFPSSFARDNLISHLVHLPVWKPISSTPSSRLKYLNMLAGFFLVLAFFSFNRAEPSLPCTSTHLSSLFSCAHSHRELLPSIPHNSFQSILQDLSVHYSVPCTKYSSSDISLLHSDLLQALDLCFLDESVHAVEALGENKGDHGKGLSPVDLPCLKPWPTLPPFYCKYECRECNTCGIPCVDVPLLESKAARFNERELEMMSIKIGCASCTRTICKKFCKGGLLPFCPLVV